MWNLFKKLSPMIKLQNAIAAFTSLLESDIKRLQQASQDLKKTTAKLDNIEKDFTRVSNQLEDSVDSSIDESLLEENANPEYRRTSDKHLQHELKILDKKFKKITGHLLKVSIPAIQISTKEIDKQSSMMRKQILKLAKNQIIVTDEGYFEQTTSLEKFEIVAPLQYLNLLLMKHKNILQSLLQYPSSNAMKEHKSKMLKTYNSSHDYLLGSFRSSAKVAPLELEHKKDENNGEKFFKKRN